MQTIHESIRLVEIPAQLGGVSAVQGSTSHRHAMTATLDRFEFPRYHDDLFIQRGQQNSRLRHPDVVGHLRILSFASNDPLILSARSRAIEPQRQAGYAQMNTSSP